MGQLSETQIKATKQGPKEFFLNDGDNLFLRVRNTGKAWVYRYEAGFIWPGTTPPTPRPSRSKTVG